MHALLVTYCLRCATSEAEHAELCEQLAPAFAVVPGLLSLTWLVNSSARCYGGFYVFEGRSAFHRFVASELFDTLKAHPSVENLETMEFSINAGPTTLTRGLVEASRA